MELLENTSMNKHIIELINNKDLSYVNIFALSSAKLQNQKTYIKTYLKIGFILSLKFLTSVSIFYNKKLNSIFFMKEQKLKRLKRHN